MKAMVIDRFGGPEELELREIPTASPGEGEVLIRVAYAGVNPADCKIRAGKLGKWEFPFPVVTGFDAAGVIDQVGPGVTDLAPGDRVTTLSDQLFGAHGSYAEYVCCRAIRVQKLPDTVSFRDGATIPVGGATAYGAVVDLGQVKAGDRVFVNGGAGSVGLFAIQLASARGAAVATTCSPRNNALVHGAGAECTIDYNAQDVMAALKAWSPDGADLIVDCIGLDSLPADSARCVGRGGRIVCIYTGIRDIQGYDAALCAELGVELILNLSAFERQSDHLRGAVEGFRNGTLQPPPITEFALADAAEAHRLSETSHVSGKLVLKVADLA